MLLLFKIGYAYLASLKMKRTEEEMDNVWKQKVHENN
jgi:hypothetical protein